MEVLRGLWPMGSPGPLALAHKRVIQLPKSSQVVPWGSKEFHGPGGSRGVQGGPEGSRGAQGHPGGPEGPRGIQGVQGDPGGSRGSKRSRRVQGRLQGRFQGYPNLPNFVLFCLTLSKVVQSLSKGFQGVQAT